MPAKSKAQQRFMGMVHSAQKGEIPASVKVRKVAKSIGYDDAKEFASTKHKDLPNKVKKETLVRELIRKLVREVMSEDFAGTLKEKDRKAFDKKRQKQSEVLGYKLMGTPDVKVQVDNATVHQVGHRKMKEGKLTEGKFYAFWKNKKHTINGKSLYDAKQQAITKLKIPKSKVGLLAVVNAGEHDKGSFRFEGKLTEGRFKLSGASEMKWGGNKIVIMTGKSKIALTKKELANMLRGIKMHRLTAGYKPEGKIYEQEPPQSKNPEEKPDAEKLKIKIPDNPFKDDELEEAKKETIFDVARRIVKDHSYDKYNGVKIDVQTANLITKVEKKMNSDHKKRFLDISKNTKNLRRFLPLLWGLVK